MLEYKDLADLSYKLATIKTNVELDRTINSLVNEKTNDQELLSWFKKLELKTWANEITINQHKDDIKTSIETKKVGVSYYIYRG